MDCYPFVLLALLSVALLIVFMGRAHAVPAANGYVVLFFSGDVVALLLSGYKAVRRIRDLVSGVALVREDILENVLAFRLPWGRRSDDAGESGQIGGLHLTSGAAVQARGRGRHRITYSPASKLVWSLEPLDWTPASDPTPAFKEFIAASILRRELFHSAPAPVAAGTNATTSPSAWRRVESGGVCEETCHRLPDRDRRAPR